jgi:uncharacterized protein (TIGR00725 family)
MIHPTFRALVVFRSVTARPAVAIRSTSGEYRQREGGCKKPEQWMKVGIVIMILARDFPPCEVRGEKGESRMASVTRLPIVGVVGSHSDAHQDRAAALGCWLAGQEVHLLTGAGPGVMCAVSKAFYEAPARRGLVIGIVPCSEKNSRTVPKDKYPNDWVELPIHTHLHLSGEQGEKDLSRNHIIALSSAVIVALPGGAGTASEVRLAIQYQRPVIAYLKNAAEIEGDIQEAEVEPDLDKVKAFVLKALGR